VKKPADHERLRRLCVQATCNLEDTHSPVMRGQAANASARRYRAIVCNLRAAAGEFKRVADAMERITGKFGAPRKTGSGRQQPWSLHDNQALIFARRLLTYRSTSGAGRALLSLFYGPAGTRSAPAGSKPDSGASVVTALMPSHPKEIPWNSPIHIS
jgi:hypothetical protein